MLLDSCGSWFNGSMSNVHLALACYAYECVRMCVSVSIGSLQCIPRSVLLSLRSPSTFFKTERLRGSSMNRMPRSPHLHFFSLPNYPYSVLEKVQCVSRSGDPGSNLVDTSNPTRRTTGSDGNRVRAGLSKR